MNWQWLNLAKAPISLQLFTISISIFCMHLAQFNYFESMLIKMSNIYFRFPNKSIDETINDMNCIIFAWSHHTACGLLIHFICPSFVFYFVCQWRLAKKTDTMTTTMKPKKCARPLRNLIRLIPTEAEHVDPYNIIYAHTHTLICVWQYKMRIYSFDSRFISFRFDSPLKWF